jgi:hypothetical protein
MGLTDFFDFMNKKMIDKFENDSKGFIDANLRSIFISRRLLELYQRGNGIDQFIVDKITEYMEKYSTYGLDEITNELEKCNTDLEELTFK